MSALIDAPVSQSRKAGDPAIISTPIASSSPRSATTPPSLASSSFITSEEDEIDKNSVINTSKPNVTPPPPVPEIAETLQILNMDTFRQILDLDEGDDHEFSLSMVDTYFSQAEETFRKLDKSYEAQNLSELSSLGHFFKGSSAAFGLEKVQASCQKIQHYGDEKANEGLKPEEALDKIKKQLAQLRKEYAEAKKNLEDWFCDQEDEHEDEHWLGVDYYIRGYGCDGWTNCVGGVTWNWPKPSL